MSPANVLPGMQFVRSELYKRLSDASRCGDVFDWAEAKGREISEIGLLNGRVEFSPAVLKHFGIEDICEADQTVEATVRKEERGFRISIRKGLKIPETGALSSRMNLLTLFSCATRECTGRYRRRKSTTTGTSE